MRPDVSWLLIQWHLSGPKSQSRINSKFDRRLSAANCMGSTGRFDFLSSSLPSETPWKAHSLVKSQLIRPTRSKPWIIDENSYRKRPSTFAAQQDSVDDVSVPEGSAEIPHHWSAEAGTACKKEWKHVLRCIDDTWARKQRHWGKKRNSTSTQQASTEIPERHLAPTCKCGPGVSIAASTIFSFCCNSGLANSKEFLGFKEMKWIPILHKCSVIHCHH